MHKADNSYNYYSVKNNDIYLVEKIKRSITIIAIIAQIPTVIIYFAVLSILAFCNESIPSKLLTIISCFEIFVGLIMFLIKYKMFLERE